MLLRPARVTRSSHLEVPRPVYFETENSDFECSDSESSDSDGEYGDIVLDNEDQNVDESAGENSSSDEESAPLVVARRKGRRPPLSTPASTNAAQKTLTKPARRKQGLGPESSSSRDNSQDSSSNNNDDHGWENRDLPQQTRPCPEFEPPHELKSPINYFQYFFDNEILDLLVVQKNLYSTCRDGKSINVTRSEMNIFLAIWIYMGICRLPSYEDYWNSYLRVPQIADAMPLKRFIKIRARFHLVDNAMPANGDRYFKVRPLLKHMQKKCQAIEQLENQYSIDESMIPYKGKKASMLRQYLPNKPHKWGFKFFLLCGTSGIAYDFLPYMGGETFSEVQFTEEETACGLGGQVVITLSKSISRPRLSTVCFDNFFTTIKLLKLLQSNMGLLATGTIRSNRLEQCPLKDDKKLLREGRGSSDVRVKDNVACVKWADNKIVTPASSLTGVEPLSSVKRWDKTSKKKNRCCVPECCPAV